jgi:peroxiredoxin
VVAISVDPMPTNQALADKLGLGDDLPLLADPDLATIRAFGVEDEGKDISLPATFVVGSDGKVRWIYVGDNPRDRPLVESVLAAVGAP